MFERYTDAARQAIFWARLSGEEAGSSSIEPQHLLTGVLGADPTLPQRYPQLAEFAPRLRHIGPEHLLLGLLREGKSSAAGMLQARSVTLDEARKNLSQKGDQSS